MYKVLVAFTDLQDNDHKYLPGNEYPRKGLNPSPERIRELATKENRRGIQLIEGEIPEIVEEKALNEPIDEAEQVEEPIEAEDQEIEPVENFMNPPEEPVEEPIEEAPKKRGRKKNAD